MGSSSGRGGILLVLSHPCHHLTQRDQPRDSSTVHGGVCLELNGQESHLKTAKNQLFSPFPFHKTAATSRQGRQGESVPLTPRLFCLDGEAPPSPGRLRNNLKPKYFTGIKFKTKSWPDTDDV